jgi:hypothetical protein
VGGLQPAPLLLRLWRLRVLILAYFQLSFCYLIHQSYLMDWLSRDLHMRTTDGGRMFSVPDEVGDATRLTNLICGRCHVHGRDSPDGSQINAIPQIYATLFRMSDLEFLLGGEVFRVQGLATRQA